MNSIRDPAGIKSWLCTTARNLALDKIRRKQVEQKYVDKLVESETYYQEAGKSHKLAEESMLTNSLLHELEIDLLGDLIDQLCKDINDDTFCLFYREGLSAKDIASRKNIAISTVTNRLSRIRKKFSESFELSIRQLQESYC